jgi:hypothetical protein
MVVQWEKSRQRPGTPHMESHPVFTLFVSIAVFGLACAFAGYLLGCHRMFGWFGGGPPRLTTCLRCLLPNHGRRTRL